MENITIPSEYLINDPREINSLKPDHVPKSLRIIDCDTRSDLIDILNGLWEATSMASGAPGCENLITQMKALITIVSESTEREAIMTNYQAGMMVRQSVIDFWPYLAQVINRINEAGNDLNFEALSDVFRDVGNVIGKVRYDVTVKELKKDFRRELRWYKNETKSIVKKRRQLQNPNPVGKYGKPLAASTLKQYGLAVKGWPKRREGLKKKILHNLDKLEAFSNQRAKIITRGGVSLKLLYGGRHAAKTWHLTKDKEWRQAR